MKSLMVLILAVGLFLLGSQSVYPVKLGVKGGFSMAKMSPFDDIDIDTNFFEYHYLNGYLVGLFVEIPLSRGLLFQPEAMITRKGVNITDDSPKFFSEDYYLEIDIKYSYLEIPALFKLNLGKGGNISPYLLAGPYMAFKFSATYRAVEDHDLGYFESEGDIETAKSIDFGVIIGAGAQIKAGNGKLLLEVRYSIGLADAFDGLSSEINDTFKSKHSMLVFVVGYVF